jgi:hypothetical protein
MERYNCGRSAGRGTVCSLLMGHTGPHYDAAKASAWPSHEVRVRTCQACGDHWFEGHPEKHRGSCAQFLAGSLFKSVPSVKA